MAALFIYIDQVIEFQNTPHELIIGQGAMLIGSNRREIGMVSLCCSGKRIQCPSFWAETEQEAKAHHLAQKRRDIS